MLDGVDGLFGNSRLRIHFELVILKAQSDIEVLFYRLDVAVENTTKIRELLLVEVG